MNNRMRKSIIILVIFLVSICGSCQKKEALSDSQIEKLREAYPATGLTGSEYIDQISPTMEEACRVVKFWAQVKCSKAVEDIYTSGNPGNEDSAIAAIDNKISSDIMAEYHFLCYEMEI